MAWPVPHIYNQQYGCAMCLMFQSWWWFMICRTSLAQRPIVLDKQPFLLWKGDTMTLPSPALHQCRSAQKLFTLSQPYWWYPRTSTLLNPSARDKTDSPWILLTDLCQLLGTQKPRKTRKTKIWGAKQDTPHANTPKYSIEIIRTARAQDSTFLGQICAGLAMPNMVCWLISPSTS